MSEASPVPVSDEPAIARWKAFALVCLVWAAIYLPGLGTEEIFGAERIRSLSAMEMLKNRNWTMPTFGGIEYYNKPPGYNWILAAGYTIAGHRDEWTVRLPSALCMLLMAAALVWLPGRWPRRDSRLLAAVVFLAAVGMVNSGRRAEIEAPYICMTGLAVFWWLSGFANGWSTWVTWIGAALLLAYGALIKGPINGFVFYAAVVCVLAYSRRLKELWSPAHIVGVALILAICLGWVYLAYQSAQKTDLMARNWSNQWLIRVAPGQEHGSSWLRNVGQALADMLPWFFLLPVLWFKRLTSRIEPDRLAMYKGLRLGAVIGFVAINAMPGSFDRYSLPVYPLTALLLGWALSGHRNLHPDDRYWLAGILVAMAAACVTAAVFNVTRPAGAQGWAVLLACAAVLAGTWLARKKIEGGLPLGLATAAVLIVASLQYTTFYLSQRPLKFRPEAQRINAAMPAGQTLYVYQPEDRTLSFYLREPMEYLLEPHDIGSGVKYLLIQPALLKGPGIQGAIPPGSFKVLAQCRVERRRADTEKDDDLRALIERGR